MTFSHSVRPWFFLILGIALMVSSVASEARINPGLLEAVTRTTANVADDVPIKHSDELLQRLGKSKSARELVDADLAKAGKLTDSMTDSARQAARHAEVLAQLKKGLVSNPVLLRQIDQLDEAGREAALVLAKGGQRLAEMVPDLAARSKLLRAGGADLVASAGLYGKDFVKDALRLQTALEAGSVVAPAGKRTITLADFSATISKMGRGGVNFFNQTIRPHWKTWIGSGLLTWWVLDPEGFQNSSGELIHDGSRRIVELAGDTAASAMTGVIEGSGNAVSNFASRTWSQFQAQGLVGIIGILILLTLGSLAFRRVRFYAATPFRWLNRRPQDD